MNISPPIRLVKIGTANLALPQTALNYHKIQSNEYGEYEPLPSGRMLLEQIAEDKRISELPIAGTIEGNEMIPFAKDYTNGKMSLSTLIGYICQELGSNLKIITSAEYDSMMNRIDQLEKKFSQLEGNAT